MNILRTVVGYLLFALNTLLLVFFALGERMQMPSWLQSIGRVHPLLLHLPIGIVVITVLLYAFRRRFEQQSFEKFFDGLLMLAALTAAVTAVMGFILAREGGYDESVLLNHSIWGAMFSYSLTVVYTANVEKKFPEKVFSIVIGVPVVAVLIAGHFGSVLTHGDDFVFGPLRSSEENKVVVTDSTSLFAAAIQPVFDRKCTSCHNEKKSKGGLILSTLAGIGKGGEHKPLLTPSHPHASLLIKRILLPEEHEDHMPPKGKSQLSASEVQLLFQWILSGADTAKAWTKYSPSDSVRKLAEQMIRSNSKSSREPHYSFEPASSATIEKLNDPYRTVAPIALNEPALAATFFIKNEFKPSKLEELSAVREQLVSLNLSKMPVTDEDCDVIRKFDHLEKLNLNFSEITEKGLRTLSSMPELKSLSIAGTSIADLNVFNDFKKLKEVFAWNTPIKPADVQNINPAITWNFGFVPDANEKLRLTPPIPVSDKTLLDKGELIVLTHKLPGAVIRYTTDGSDPDSTSAKAYDTPFAIDGYTTLKTRACKDGWFCSPIGTFVLYTKGVHPLETKLNTRPNKDYKGEGAATLSNNKKGFADDHRDIAWIGFRENPMSAEFKFAPGTTIKDITLSYDRNLYGWLFPPAKIEIWGGKDEAHLALVKKLNPEQPKALEYTKNAALVIPMENSYEVYKIIAWPVAELPKWHPSNNPKTKDKRAWLFIDEIIFGQ